MSTKNSLPARVGTVVKWAFLAVGIVAVLIPFIWMLSGSFRTEADLFANPASLLPAAISFDGYAMIWNELPFLRLLINTVVFTVVTTVFLIIFDSMCAYALARLRFRGRNVVLIVILGSLMIPFQVTLMPVFIELFQLGWLDTYQGLIVPRAASAFGIFLFRQFFIDLPTELDEAARLDGASHWRIYWQIILPLSKPAIATVAVITSMALWNDLLWPLVVASNVNMSTLPAGLTLFTGQHISNHSVVLAGAVISLIPIALAFFLAQKYFISGVARAGLK